MKKSKLNLWLILAVVAFSACNKDTVEPADGTIPDLPKEKATVNFQMDAAAFKSTPQTRAGQVYDDIDQLRILAFRKSGGNFVYITDVDKGKIKMEGTTFKGSAQLPVGTYRFIPAYGVPKANDANLSLDPIQVSTPYSDQLKVTHKENGNLPAIFLQEENVAVEDYDLGLDSKETNKTVSLSLTRAIARLDIQFVQGKKNGEGYTEKAGPVFGTNTDLATLTLDFKGLNPSVQLTNGKLVSENITPLNTQFVVNLGEAQTKGTANATIYGEKKADGTAYDYEVIAGTDFINGSSHIYGPFLFPFAEGATKGTDLTLTLTSTTDPATQQTYTRTIHVDNVPLSRNKVTLVKIYSGGDDIFHTNTAFEIIVNKAWEKHGEVSGAVE